MSERTRIALLRGINVGGKVLKMADLKSAVAELGFTDIATYLQSGNMVFQAPPAANSELSARIVEAIRVHARMDLAVMVRSSDEWRQIVERNPFPQASEAPRTVHAFILDATPEQARLDALAAKDVGREDWRIVNGTLYLHTPDGFGKSVLAGSIERILKVPMTARNWNTVLALRDLASRS